MDITRRQKLTFLTSVSICGLSGCVNNIPGLNPGGNPEYDYARERPIYISEGIDLQFPDGINKATSVDDADMIVLSTETDTSADNVVSWMRGQKAVSVFGDGDDVKETWDVWRESDAYREIEGEARAGSTQASADSKMLAARWKKQSIVAASTSTWGSDPGGGELIEHIDYAFQLMDEDGSLPSDGDS